MKHILLMEIFYCTMLSGKSSCAYKVFDKETSTLLTIPMTHFLCWLLGLPPSIDFSKVKHFDSTPPKVVIHKRNIPASFISLSIAVMIFLFVTQTRVLQDAYAATDMWFDSIAQFMNESRVAELTIRTFGFIFSFGVFWFIPLASCLIALIRCVLEMWPQLKNHREFSVE